MKMFNSMRRNNISSNSFANKKKSQSQINLEKKQDDPPIKTKANSFVPQIEHQKLPIGQINLTLRSIFQEGLPLTMSFPLNASTTQNLSYMEGGDSARDPKTEEKPIETN